MNIFQWLDEDFFSLGCFFPMDDKIILAKGGTWSESSQKERLEFQVRDFYQHKKSFYHPADIIIITKNELQKALPAHEKEYQTSGEKRFQDLFKKDFKLFRSAPLGLKKAVLMSRVEFLTEAPHLLKKRSFCRSILSTIGEPYGFWRNNYSIIGSTPEVLFDTDRSTIHTFALAGTAPKNHSAELILSKKNTHEHDIVIKNIMEDLAPFCYELQRSQTQLSSYGDLVHLKTLIEGKIKEELEIDDLITALSPTAALGGYPREEARRFLLQTHYHYLFPQRFHGSSFTVSHEGQTRSLVMIRNIQLQNNTLIIEAGAGVVEGSEEESEFAEINHKIKIAMDTLL